MQTQYEIPHGSLVLLQVNYELPTEAVQKLDDYITNTLKSTPVIVKRQHGELGAPDVLVLSHQPHSEYQVRG